MIILPIVAFAGLFFRALQSAGDLRAAFVRAALVWGAVLIVLSEVLSWFSAMAFVPLAAAWLVITVIARLPLPHVRVWRPPAIPLALAIPSIIILVGTLVVALAAPPNTFDSMTYHMSRVEHWMQARSIGTYPTDIHRQLYMAPWAETAILHLQILSHGSDRFANMVQWSAFGGCMIVVSLLVARFGGSPVSQWLAVLLVAATPELIAQSTSTQTDLICAFWVACFAAVLMDPGRWIFPGLALGLAIATKGTAYVFCAPILAAWLIAQWRECGFGSAARVGLIVGTIAVALNAGQLVRNQRTFGDPLGDPAQLKMVSMETYAPGAVVVNAVKNAALHLGTPFDAVNTVLTRAVRAVGHAFHADVDDPSTSVFGDFAVPTTSTHEDYAGNLVFLVLALASMVAAARFPPPLRRYVLCVVGGGLLFAALLKWQPWNARLHSPFFVLAAVPAAVWLAGVLRTPAQLRTIGIALFVAALPWVVLNASRPMVSWRGVGSVFTTPREDQYFVNNPDVGALMRELAHRIADTGCHTIGLKTHENGWEYPLWRLTRSQSVRIEYVDADTGGPTPGVQPRPCLLVTIHPPAAFHIDAHEWPRVLHLGAFDLFAAAGSLHETGSEVPR